MTKDERRNAIRLEVVRLMSEVRERQELSRNKLAELTGLNQSTISRLESNPENPTFDSLLRVADALELNLGEVIKKAIGNIDKERK